MLTRGRGTIVVLPAIVWLAIFFLLPLAFILVVSLGSRDELGRIVLDNLSLDNYRKAFNPDYLPTLINALRYAALTTVTSLLIGFPIAYWISRYGGHRKALLLVLVMLPFWTSYLIRTYAWMIILRDNGIVNSVLQAIGLTSEPIILLNTDFSVVLGMTYGFLPFAILPMFVSIDRIDQNLVAAARDLYASGRSAFLHVTLPLAMPGIIAASLLVVHPGDGRLRDTGPARWRAADDHRQGHPGALPRRPRLAVRVGARVHPDRGHDGRDAHRPAPRPARVHRRMRTAGTRGAADEPRAQPAADRVRGARLRVPVRPDRRADHLLVQRFAAVVRVARLHHGLVRQAAGQRRPARGGRHDHPGRVSSRCVVSTILGSLLGLGLARLRFRGHGSTETLLLLPMVTPEIVLGLSLLLFFVALFDSRGSFAQLSIAHITFCISFVAVVVRSRAAGMNPHLEEAARDLGATAWGAFRHVTLPLIAPGIVAGGLLALSLSIDDYVVSAFNAGIGSTTLPLYIYSAIKFGVSPEINAISTIVVAITALAIIVAWRLGTFKGEDAVSDDAA